MKKNVFFVAILFLILSCKDNTTNSESSNKKEVPAAFNEKKIISRGSFESSGGDIITELYQEIENKNPELKKLSDDYELLTENQGKILEKPQEFMRNNSRYYSSAEDRYTGIKDSILKNEIKNVIVQHQKNFENKNRNIQDALKIIDTKNIEISDYYAVLMILKTLPELEKYQNDQQPNPTELNKLIAEQQKMIEKLKQLKSQ